MSYLILKYPIHKTNYAMYSSLSRKKCKLFNQPTWLQMHNDQKKMKNENKPMATLLHLNNMFALQFCWCAF